MQTYFEPEIRNSISLKDAIPAIEQSLAAYSSGLAILPGVINLDLPEFEGEVHVKAAYLAGHDHYVIKVASGFYKNPLHGLPAGDGLMLVYKAMTGELAAILFDRGYLTDLRTAAAGAVAAKYLARADLRRVAVIGSGVQARLQLLALAEVRTFPEVSVWSRQPENAGRYVKEMAEVFPEVKFHPFPSPEQAVREADLIITATASRQPLIKAEWLEPGVQITAMGSDGPEKQELYPEVLARADFIFCDSVNQCRHLGEVHHALQVGVISEDKISGEIGELVLGRKVGRRSAEDITVADLTGLGIQDAAIAGLFLSLAGDKQENK